MGWLAVLVAEDYPAVMVLFTLAMSLPCFHILLNTSNGRVGQFTLLAYSVVVLGRFHESQQIQETLILLVMHRTVAVGFGCLVGLFVMNYIWP